MIKDGGEMIEDGIKWDKMKRKDNAWSEIRKWCHKINYSKIKGNDKGWSEIELANGHAWVKLRWHNFIK